jgi:membrane associated rhomboid family serine protease
MYRGRTMSLSFPPFTRWVKRLIIAYAAVYLLQLILRQFSAGAEGYFRAFFALVPSFVLHGWVWQLISYSFLHDGFFHLLFNALALWMFGSQLELDWGRNQFLEYFFYCVAGAALVTVAVSYTGIGHVSPLIPTVGASGGIFGILAAYGMIYGENEILLFPIPISIKAKYFVIGLVFIALVGALGSAGPGLGSNVAYFAHLGGLLFGFLYIKFLPKRGLVYGLSERYFRIRNDYYRAKRRRAARKFEVYMREHGNVPGRFDEYGNYIPPNDKQDGKGKSGWVN